MKANGDWYRFLVVTYSELIFGPIVKAMNGLLLVVNPSLFLCSLTLFLSCLVWRHGSWIKKPFQTHHIDIVLTPKTPNKKKRCVFNFVTMWKKERTKKAIQTFLHLSGFFLSAQYSGEFSSPLIWGHGVTKYAVGQMIKFKTSCL